MTKRINIFVVTLCFFISGQALAQTESLKKVEVMILNDQYALAAAECKKILAHHQKASIKSKAYYLLGLCQLKQSEYAQARDNFRNLLRKFKTSRFADQAKLGIADSYLLAGNFKQAQAGYEKFLAEFPRSNLVTLARTHLQQSKQKKHLPHAYFAVQIGVFSKQQNASGLRDELISRGFKAFIVELPAERLYRVHVGQYSNRLDAEFLEQRLRSAGYETKVCP